MRYLLSSLLLLFSLSGFAQNPNLLTHIGLNGLPADSDPICEIPWYLSSDYYSPGPDIGDTIPDFTLYKTNGDSLNMAEELGLGLPVLLVSGSYTCPVFRAKVDDLNSMASIYSGLLSIYVVYCVEAHPTDTSPYNGNIWITSANQNEGILFPQPTTYGERKALADSAALNLGIVPDILIDGPCNEWWSNFGPAPQNAYLITTDGLVHDKHGWFNKLPDNMFCTLDSMFSITSGECDSVGNNGNFDFSFDTDTIDYGVPEEVLDVHATLTNLSQTDNVEIDILRMEENLPNAWSTAMCVDVCLDTLVDTTFVIIPPGESQSFTAYFYTGKPADQGSVKIGFRNRQNNQNRFIRWFYGETESVTSTQQIEKRTDAPSLFPNPTNADATISFPSPYTGSIELFDLQGRLAWQFENITDREQLTLNLSTFESGIYFVRFVGNSWSGVQKIIVR